MGTGYTASLYTHGIGNYEPDLRAVRLPVPYATLLGVGVGAASSFAVALATCPTGLAAAIAVAAAAAARKDEEGRVCEPRG